jgi:transposase
MAVRLQVQVRKFFCRNPQCVRVVFSERLPAMVAAYARRTYRLKAEQRQLGLDLGGEVGARTAQRQGMAVSGDTLLRLVRQPPLPERPTPRILGVDDWSLRKGQTYGTILVDLETHRPVDLLADRTAETLARWLAEHPGVEIISRDRANEYIEGASRGAPNAIQVADRFHLLQNVREIVQRLLDRHQAALRAATAARDAAEDGAVLPEGQPPLPQECSPIDSSATPPEPSAAERPIVSSKATKAEQQRAASQARRLARYNMVRDLYASGMSQRQIVRQLGMSIRTVRRFAIADQFPQRATRRKMASKLDPFLPYLQQQLTAGQDNAMQLWRQLREQYGYTGSRPLVSRWVAMHRHLCPKPRPDQPRPRRRGKPPGPVSVQPKQRVLSARQAAWLFVRRPQDLGEEEQQRLQRLCHHCTDVQTAYTLVQEFIQMVKQRSATRFDDWLSRTEASGIPELQDFGAGLRRDYAAVVAALSLPYSNGQVEGQVNRLKLIKRSMYGRASFDLLRRRVLAA